MIIPIELYIKIMTYLKNCCNCNKYFIYNEWYVCRSCKKFWCQKCSLIPSAPRLLYLEISLPICKLCRNYIMSIKST